MSDNKLHEVKEHLKNVLESAKLDLFTIVHDPMHESKLRGYIKGLELTLSLLKETK